VIGYKIYCLFYYAGLRKLISLATKTPRSFFCSSMNSFSVSSHLGYRWSN